jgi:hypothetical protein
MLFSLAVAATTVWLLFDSFFGCHATAKQFG